MKCLSRFSVLLLMFLSGPAALAQPQQASRPSQSSGEVTAWRSFSASVNDYIKLRERLKQELPGLVVTEKPAEFVAASDVLAQAVQRANPNASQGRFFNTEAAAEIRRRLVEYARTHDMRAILAPIPEERPTVRGVDVYTRFPMSSPMPSMPPGILAQLPPLPAALEYRLLGRVLILRDTDAALVLDYLPDAVAAVK